MVSPVPLTHLSWVRGGSSVAHPTFLLFLLEVCVCVEGVYLY